MGQFLTRHVSRRVRHFPGRGGSVLSATVQHTCGASRIHRACDVKRLASALSLSALEVLLYGLRAHRMGGLPGGTALGLRRWADVVR